jgi:hypothetical protein
VARPHTRTVPSKLPETMTGAAVQLRDNHRVHGADGAGEEFLFAPIAAQPRQTAARPRYPARPLASGRS